MTLDRHTIAPLPLRLMLGIAFIYHGYPKLFDGQERAGFVEMLGGLGVPLPEVMGWVVGIVEFGGGIALLLGAATLVATSLLIIQQLGAMFLVHWPNGFAFTNEPPGIEVNLLFIAMLLALLLGGAGAFSVDGAARTRATDT